MSNIAMMLPPPQNWQDFEKLMRGIVDVIWKQQGWQQYGRPGQAQSGIDLFGYDNENRFTGIQCKKVNTTNDEGVLLKTSLLTEKVIKQEIKAAEKIDHPKLERFIFATTSSRDVGVQDIIRSITVERKKTKDLFSVEIWFWEDIVIHIEKHQELQYLYYSEVAPMVLKYDKDTHILLVLKQAFTRPAFSRPMNREESGGDFLTAIKNTMETITTGMLYNRRGQLISSSADYTQLSTPSLRTAVREIYDWLNVIRDLYQDGLKNHTIREHPTVLEVLDGRLADQFNHLRSKCLKKLNGVLKELNIELVESELL
ncbi:MAG: hypothetical protein V4539_17190 [Bacteroidota bacterium]